MTSVIGQVNVDCAEPLALAGWWAEVLGWTVNAEDGPDFVSIEDPSPGGPVRQEILFARVPEAKTVKNRLHLDLRPADDTDQATELQRLLDLGARHADVGQGEQTWHVLADPEGNEFCLLRSTPSQLAAILSRG